MVLAIQIKTKILKHIHGTRKEDTGRSVVNLPGCNIASHKQKIKTYLSRFENPEALPNEN